LYYGIIIQFYGLPELMEDVSCNQDAIVPKTGIQALVYLIGVLLVLVSYFCVYCGKLPTSTPTKAILFHLCVLNALGLLIGLAILFRAVLLLSFLPFVLFVFVLVLVFVLV